MSHEPPTPPSELPTDIVDALNECRAEDLRDVSRYAEELAAHKEREARRTERDEKEVEPTGDRPDDVPTKATITIKEINDNRYY